MLRLKQILVGAPTLVASMFLLTACGQTGALYLPPAADAPASAQPPAQPPAVATPPAKNP